MTADGTATVPGQGPRYPPQELTGLLALRHRPTDEQAGVIAAPVAPLLVVAGAGAGKTDTMANRVAWLVANGHVRPEQVLGLTFTRKAAGELAHRVRLRLGQLRRRFGREGGAGHGSGAEPAPDGEPTVLTYHAYAARVLAEHGVRAGYEPAARLLTEAARWQLADALVRAYDGDMTGVTFAPDTVTDAVLSLADACAEHLCTPDDIARWTGRFTSALTAPPGRPYAEVRRVRERAQVRLKLLPLVRAFQERKRDEEALDFGDQLARAARLARDHPEVGRLERDRFRVVLLDEYQDTSYAQSVLLHALFGGHPVAAVGDPCQSIYGWRGASAGTLERFPRLFPAPDGGPARSRKMTVSWRNRPEILTVANRLAGPLRAAGARVAMLTAAPRPEPPLAGGPAVRCTLCDTDRDEAQWLADQLRAAWDAAQDAARAVPQGASQGALPTCAVLTRRRDQLPVVADALRARGLPVELVGLGGLLDTPEVRDVVCTLRVLADPTDGPALVRLLTGARWRLGARDLMALHHRARTLAAARRAVAQGDPGSDGGDGDGGAPADPTDAEAAATLPDRLDEATLAEALLDLGEPSAYSTAGYARLRAYADELSALRGRLDQPLPDLVADVEHTLGLDVEVAVRAGAAGTAGTAGGSSAGGAAGTAGDDGTGASLARGHLDAFGEVAARFAAEAPGATLAAFLSYLAAAEDEERGLDPGEVEVAEGAVQLLTAHAAKGLEWDVVAVAGLSDRMWPPPPKRGDHYLHGIGVLPFPLRGDADALPSFDPTHAEGQRQVEQARLQFEDDWRAHDEREERRLAYVAVTRARRLLLASGAWWTGRVRRPRGASPFLTEIADACRAGAGLVDGWAEEPAADATNPSADADASAAWPADPLGDRRPVLEEAADLVRDALAETAGEVPAGEVPGHEDPADASGQDDPVAARWSEEATLLLAERAAAAGSGEVAVPLPRQLSASQLVTLRRDPEALARNLRRPMPAPPDPYARRGTAFHAWLEQWLDHDGLWDVDDVPGAADDGAAPDEALAALQQAFLASAWAERTPEAVEVPFATEIGGVVVRGRIDAVFADGDGGYDVIDWKTGRRPSGEAADAAAVQLAVYRLAWAQLAGVPVDRVRAGFHYVAEDVTVRPVDLLDADALAALLPDS